MNEDKPKVKRKFKQRRQSMSLNAEIRVAARQIHKSGLAEAMTAATLVVVSRKLDELRALVASVVGSAAMSGMPSHGMAPQLPTATPSPPPPPPAVKNACVHCGREGVYRTRANQWNRTGSWYCRIHMPLAGQIEAEDRMDRAIQPQAPPPPPQQLQMVDSHPEQGPNPGASSMAEALGMAEIVNE
jgi:hypothetical protein